MNLEYWPTAPTRLLFTSISIYFRAVLLTYLATYTEAAVRCSTPWSAGGREAATGIWRPGRVSPRSVLADRGSARARAGPRESKAGCDCARVFRRSMGLCEGADGQHCTFLASTSCKHLPHILQKLRYRGACAELASGEATTPR